MAKFIELKAIPDGEKIYVNPETVRMVKANPDGTGTIIIFADEHPFLVVLEKTQDVIIKLRA